MAATSDTGGELHLLDFERFEFYIISSLFGRGLFDAEHKVCRRWRWSCRENVLALCPDERHLSSGVHTNRKY